ncbi:unnamed protein product [Sympodiomycopsis kandeliae]
MADYYHSQRDYAQSRAPSHYQGSAAPPPAYQYTGGDDSLEYMDDRNTHAQEEEGFEYVYPTATGTSTSPQRRQSKMSHQAHSNNGHLAVSGAGVGAGSNAYRRPSEFDSPSVYTDPYEWQSNAGRSNANTVTPNPQAGPEYLDQDPYHGGHAATGSQDLYRKDTLRPGDSISVCNVPAPVARGTTAHQGGSDYRHVNQHDDYYDEDADGYQSYNAGDRHNRQESSMSGAGYAYPMGAAAPYHFQNGSGYYPSGNGAPTHMDYADDEYDQDRRLKHASYYDDYKSQDGHTYSTHDAPNTRGGDYGGGAAPPPGLFSNQMPMTMNDAEGAVNGKSTFEGHEDGSKRGLLGFKTDSLDDQIEKRRRGIGRQRWPIVSWVLSVAFVAVFVVGLIKAKQETGQAIQTHPYVNPMLGPSSQFQISFGARFVPCMRKVPAVPTTLELPCLNASTKATVSNSETCPLWEICGLPDANSVGQSWRFVTPIFLHAGFVHIIFNLLVQLTLCSQIEKLLGSFYFVIIYIAGGIGGNLLGGNFGLVATPSVGASGSIYTCISVELIDLIYNWKYEYRAKTRLVTSILFTIIGLAVGLLPGLDNFAHLGGLAIGILGGLLFAPSIHTTKQHRIVTWVLRLAALGLLIGFFVALTTNFYNSDDPTKACTWCRYLSCLPTFKQCQNNGLTTTSTSSSSRRDLFLL